LLVFRARDFPALPAVRASLLDGKEGVDGSGPEEAFEPPDGFIPFGLEPARK
jgi:hypothetical protein